MMGKKSLKSASAPRTLWESAIGLLLRLKLVVGRPGFLTLSKTVSI